jgi:8-oxo-dGTP pyrophosphatase MutT (NUDIX family)
VGRRIDYYDDPSAPPADALVPSVNVVAANNVGDILMIRRSDNDNWAVPGGAIDLGESVLATVRTPTSRCSANDSLVMRKELRSASACPPVHETTACTLPPT